jgi:hypothetical protein
MKKFVCFLVIVGVLGFFAFTPAEAGSWGWVLYDDFDLGVIDPSLWEIFGPAGTITVVGGKLRIENINTSSGTNTGLYFKMNPERIKEVKVMAMVEVGSHYEIQTRIGGYIGEQDGNKIFKRIAIRPHHDPTFRRIDCWTGSDDSSYAIHFTHFGSPIDMGVFYEMGMNFSRCFFTSWAKGFGKNYYIPQQRILATSPPRSLQIGTRIGGESITASGVAWFDNVYVRYW